jgi:hypothetical protein
MGVDHRAIDLHFYSRVKGEVVWDADASGIAADSSWIDGSGVYRRVDGRSVVAIDEGEVRDAMSLVATVAHELGHVLLRGNNRIVEGRADEEPLTDVLNVYFGRESSPPTRRCRSTNEPPSGSPSTTQRTAAVRGI